MSKLAILLLLLYSFKTCFSQELPNITPPSPTAFELGKYGHAPLGLNTGTVQVSIPIYTYKTRNLNVPISLSYRSNGIKVDELSSNVGLGWSLNAGGVITRLVRDENDENRGVFYPDEEIELFGLSSPITRDYLHLASGEGVDSEPDLFMYNFLGHTGQFILDPKGYIHLVPHRDHKIETFIANDYRQGFRIITSDGVAHLFLDEEHTVNRSSGTGENAPGPSISCTSWYLSQVIHPLGDTINFEYTDQNYNYDVSKSQSISLATPIMQASCDGSSTGAGLIVKPLITSNLKVIGKRLTEIRANKSVNGKVIFSANQSHPDDKLPGYKLVTNISVQNANQVLIEKADLSYLSTPNDRVFLEQVRFNDPDKSYFFEYMDPEGLPERLSKAQDHWGYANGKTSNQVYYPNPRTIPFAPIEFQYYNVGADKSIDPIYTQKGLLKKIQYPTKGHSTYSYESNSYWGEKTIYPDRTNLTLTVSTDDAQTGTPYEVMGNIPPIPSDHRAALSVYASFNSQECTQDLLKSKVSVQILDNQTNTVVPILEHRPMGYLNVGTSLIISHDAPNNHFFVDFEQGHSYTIKLKPLFFCTQGTLDLSYYDQAITTQFQNIPTGGMRVKQITDYGFESQPSKVSNFFYGKKETPHQSSGEKGRTVNYFSKETKRTYCDASSSGDTPDCDIYSDQYFTTLNASSLHSLYHSSQNGTTYYRYVTISQGGTYFENGGEAYEFFINNDHPDNPLLGEPVPNATWVNSGWSNGLLKRKSIFKKDPVTNTLITLSETTNSYIADSRHFKKVFGYAIRSRYWEQCPGGTSYTCSSSDVSKQLQYIKCTANHEHAYHYTTNNGSPNARYCMAPGAMHTPVYYDHPCYGRVVGSTVVVLNLANLDVTEYSTNSYWHYLDQTTTTTYDEQGQNPITTATNYFYDNEDHLQLTRIVKTNSKNEPLRTTNYYPNDVTEMTSLGFDDLTLSEMRAVDSLKSQYRIAEPLQVESYRNNQLISTIRNLNKYWSDDFVMPFAIQSSKGSGTLKDQIINHSYFPDGNIKEVSRKDGSYITYLWGYDGTLPVAKIENARFSYVPNSIYTAIINASNLDITQSNAFSETTLRQALADLRNHPNLTNAQVTTYTYDPMIGVTTVCDARGEITYYEYDNFNRLQFIKDANGHIVRSTEYNYSE